MVTPKQVVYTPVDVDDATYAEFSAEPSEDEIEFQKFKDEFKQANEYAKVSCYRQPTTSDGRPGQKNLTFLFEAGVEEFSFSQLAGRLRDEYGTGTYRIQLRDKENMMKMNRAVSIEAPKVKGDETTPGNIIAIVSQALQEQQIRTENMFRQMTGPRTGGDAMDQMTKMATAMATIMGAMGVTPQQQQPPKTLMEQLTEFKIIKELFGSDSDSSESGDANIYSLLGKTVEAFGGPIAAAIAAGAESGDLSQTGLAALPAPPLTGAEAMTEQERHKMAMRKNIHILIQNAKTEIPPESFALILVNNTPEEKQDELWDFISAPNCVEIILEIEPAAEPYKQWFEDLRKEVISLMADDPGEDDKELQPGDDAPSISESETVAGDEDEATSLGESESSGKSNGDTSEHT